MTKLESITLSNIRRFGQETNIKLSPGATILLAPNGTGKTAFFEAVELGLTGKISRLGDDLTPIIRDSQDVASVNLNFGETQISSKVNTYGETIHCGSLERIFPETDPSDIPFLLRLTHLLDQRGKDWLVQADSKSAGSQLSRLPIGRDGSQVSASLNSIRRSITDQVKQARSALASYEDELADWQSLIAERDLSASQSKEALRSRETIIGTVTKIAQQAELIEQLPMGLLSEPVRQDALETVYSTLEDLLQSKIESLRDKTIALNGIDDLIEKFDSEQARIDNFYKELSKENSLLKDKRHEREKIAAEKEVLQKEIAHIEQLQTSITQQLNWHENEANAKQEVDQRTIAVQEANDALIKAEKDYSELKEAFERHEYERVQHEKIREQSRTLEKKESDLRTAQQLVNQWIDTARGKSNLSLAIGAAKEEIESLRGKLQDALFKRDKCQADEAQAKNNHVAIDSAADAVRQAVALIASHLPEDRSDCPLCGVEHGPQELQKRVHEALETIDPNVVTAEHRHKTASDKRRASEGAVTVAQSELKACIDKLSSLEVQESDLASKIESFRSHPLIASGTISLAQDLIKDKTEEVANSRQQLAEKKKKLNTFVGEEYFDFVKTSYHTASLSLETTRKNRFEAITRLKQADASYAAIASGDIPSKTLAELSVEKNKIEKKLYEMNSKENEQQSFLEKNESQISEINHRISKLENQLKEVQSRVSQYRASWYSFRLPGDPDSEVSYRHKLQLEMIVSQLENHYSALESINSEIVAWGNFEKTRTTQEFLDRRRGDLSEDEFCEELNKKLETEKADVEQLTSLSNAMESFGGFLSTEIKNVQKHVVSVVPRWQALLKRIIRDQRFSETSLDFYSAYKKERAEVSAPLHNKKVSVPAIASEAQLTDLQLTFLLSMAMNHHWSPWRALLLDDPTQHHDLVHASSVFDVLRDYIVEHKFQVVVATHDAIQARYFMRKLQNDGIDVRVWSLVPGHGGVTAEEINFSKRKSKPS
ncbi:AAA family ATPase [Cobetia sp. AM6]|uniref:AAA family ATPase n=1 Tax=Cobetia sp. AM6 TaxID=2661553 RepID=UPI0012994322|nr:AAA family ATPase [Cobetia sp. AM6]BBO56428.1 chromosome segregation protein SMC [Cobetia sp. AM6]